MASVDYGDRLRDERTAAMACWLDRRLKERGQAESQELERLRRRAAFDVAARVRLVAVERRERVAHARWMAAVEEASDEELDLFIWPPT